MDENDYEEKETLTLNDIDIIGSVEFDLSESLRDLFYIIKQLKSDVDCIKDYLHLKN